MKRAHLTCAIFSLGTMNDAWQGLGRSVQREGLMYLRATVIKRVETETDEATGQHDLSAENPDCVYAVSRNEEENDLASAVG